MSGGLRELPFMSSACRHGEGVGCEGCERAAIVWAELADENKCPNPCRPKAGPCACAVDADRIVARQMRERRRS